MGRLQSTLRPARAFREFHAHHADALVRFFARRVYDPQVALDLASETFAKAFVKRGAFRGATGDEAAAWLYAIAQRELATFYRRGATETKALERLGIQMPRAADDELERIEQLADLASARGAIQRAMARLDEHQRLALEMRVVDERPYSDLARAFGVSEQTARARVSRALKQLSDIVDLEPEPQEAP